MYLIILIFLLQTTKQQQQEQQFTNVMGLQQLDVWDLISSKLKTDTKLVITLSFQEHEIPLLVICQSKPKLMSVNDPQDLLKQQCNGDVNAYSFQQQIQAISLKNEVVSSDISKIYNVYELLNDKIFVGAYSKANSTYKIIAQTRSSFLCAKTCKNGGTCFHGFCECLDGYFGDDCSISGLNIINQTELNPNTVYYLSLQEQYGSTFLRILQMSIQLRQFCYSNEPFIKQGDVMITNLLQLDSNQITNCRSSTLQLESEVKIKFHASFLFMLNSPFQVKIMNTSQSDTSDADDKLLIFILIPLLILLFLVISLCCLAQCCRKKSVEIVLPEKVPDYMDQHMAVQIYNDVVEPGQVFQSREDQYCAICLEQFGQFNKIRVTYCNHIFHSQCLVQWLRKISTCPLCRAFLDEGTVNSMMPRRTLNLLDQISSNLQQNGKFKPPTVNSLSNLTNLDNKQQHQDLINHQRSLAMIDQQ